jgi:hypothetical protein
MSLSRESAESGNPIVKWHCTFNGMMSSAALLVPLMTAADSRLQTGAPTTALSASVQVNFKIVIPQVLYLGNAGLDTVSIMTNSRNVTLSADVRASDSSPHAHGNVVLSAATGKVIAQDSRCKPDSPGTGAHQVICTASMP